LASLHLPTFLLIPLIRLYSNFYRVNLSEVKQELKEFSSFSEFFVRDLVEGARPAEEGFVSPADGRIDQFGHFDGNTLIQAKGKEYSLDSFLGSEDLAKEYQGGSFLTIYLSPADYHNVHSPLNSRLDEMCHIPGTLWPVNNWSVQNVDQLFAVNERVVFQLSSEDTGCLLVMVGATNVGSIGVPFSDFRSNSLKRIVAGSQYEGLVFNPAISIEKGEKLGSFFLGSTVVLIFKNGEMSFSNIESGQAVRLGQNLGELNGAGARLERQ